MQGPEIRPFWCESRCGTRNEANGEGPLVRDAATCLARRHALRRHALRGRSQSKPNPEGTFALRLRLAAAPPTDHTPVVLPEGATIDWIFEASRWWLESFGGFAQFETTPTVLPTKDDFPVDLSLRDHALAEDYFTFAKEHAGFGEWPLVIVSDAVPNVAEVLRGMPHGMTAPVKGEESTPLREGDPLAIPYDPALLDDPVALVASMARGMSHYHLYEAPTPFPGEEEDRKYFVDLGAVFLGFGVFLTNAAFRFKQTESGMMIGWGYTRHGALSELDLSYALALACVLTGAPDKTIRRHLKPNPKGFFKAAYKHLRKKRRDDVERLRRVESPSGGPYR